MHSFSEILIAPPAVEILRIADAGQASASSSARGGSPA
jgi:hypothetical protein